MGGGPTHPPNPAGRRALKQEYEQATDAAGAVEDDRKTGAWLLVGCLVVGRVLGCWSGAWLLVGCLVVTMSPTLHPHNRGRAVLAHIVVCR